MDFTWVRDYWPQIIFVCGIIAGLAALRTRVSVLEEKVKVAFELINSINNFLRK